MFRFRGEISIDFQNFYKFCEMKAFKDVLENITYRNWPEISRHPVIKFLIENFITLAEMVAFIQKLSMQTCDYLNDEFNFFDVVG